MKIIITVIVTLLFYWIILFTAVRWVNKFYDFYETKLLESKWLLKNKWCIWLTEMVCKEKCSYE